MHCIIIAVDCEVIITPAGSINTIAGDTYELICSITIGLNCTVTDVNFDWFYGPNGNGSLPSSLTPTIISNCNSTSETFTSTLQFSPLNQSHAGMYTCRLGGNDIDNSARAVITVNGIINFL